MNRTDLRKRIEASLEKSMRTKEGKMLDCLIEEGTSVESLLFESGWHLESTKSETLTDLAKKLSK